MQIHDRRSYISAQGDRADYDVKTGDLTCLFIENVADLDETQVSEEQAREIADAFIKKYCDLSEYELMRCKYNSVTGTDVTYAKYICGVRTSDWVGVNVWMDGTISSFFRNPHIFDNMDIKSIDIASMRSEVGKQMKEKYKDRLADYSIVDECLILDDSGRPQVKILVEPQMKDSDGSGALDDYYFPLQ